MKPLFRFLHTVSVLGWPAWLRVATVLPVCIALWFAVAWALTEMTA